MAPSSSLVVVLPAEPVMPTSRSGVRVRAKRARSWRAWKVSSTRISAPDETDRSSCTIAAAAPRASASGTKRWPSVCAPAKAKKTSPPRTARESIAAPSITDCGWAGAIRPPTARAASSTVNLATARLQGLADLLDVGERKLLVCQNLIGLVTLAGHQHGPARLRLGDRLADRLAAVGDEPVSLVAALLQALFDRRQDGQRVLAPRVVRGGDHQVGELAGDLPHQRPLAGVAVAAAAEHHRHLAAAHHLARRAQGGLQGRVGVGVVDED